MLLAQVVNTGQTITISANGLLFVDNSYVHHAGTILNNGKLEVKGNWLNNPSVPSALSPLVFDSQSKGLVTLSGGQQKIGGASKTTFPNLELSGSDFKFMLADVDVSGSLKLNDKELKLLQHNLNVLSPDNNAISRTSGFVSTDKGGKLYRKTSSTGTYLFPFGSSLSGSAIYRPVEMQPQVSGEAVYSGSFFYKDPSLAGYSSSSKRPDIDKIFDKYFYELSFDSGVGATNVNFLQNTGDGDYRQITKWISPGVWEKAAPSTSNDGSYGDGLNRSLLFTSLSGFKDMPFSFSTSSDMSPLTLFNAFSPDGDGKNDTWIVKNLDLYPNNELLIFNRWGDEVYKAKSYNSANAWDGANLQAGTYFYVLNVEINGDKKVYKGFISMAKKN
jgi:gliding motility-associated-like protein